MLNVELKFFFAKILHNMCIIKSNYKNKTLNLILIRLILCELLSIYGLVLDSVYTKTFSHTDFTHISIWFLYLFCFDYSLHMNYLNKLYKTIVTLYVRLYFSAFTHMWQLCNMNFYLYHHFKCISLKWISYWLIEYKNAN